MIKLDQKDKKLLAFLDENARYTNTQLAKKVGLSKPAVEYRLNRFQQNNIIFAYYTVIDFTRLDYSQYKVYFKFQNASIEDEEEMINYWKKQSNSVWIAGIRGRWDITVSILAKNNYDFGRILTGFMNQYSQFILEKDVLLTEYSPIYSREYLPETKQTEFVYGIPLQPYELDETDKLILKTISTNARISIVQLIEKTKLSRDIITYRLKKLQKDKIITQYRCYPNLDVIGVRLYKTILRTKNLNEQEEKRLNQFIKQNKKATQLLKLIGSWDFEIEFETENEDELYEALNEIRILFSGIIRDFDIIRITKTHKYDYFPF